MKVLQACVDLAEKVQSLETRLRSGVRLSALHLRSSAFPMLLLVSGCAIGPNYSKPEAIAPEQWKEAGDWVVANPSDAAPKGKWWEAFNDPVLDSLAEQVSVTNQSLAAAEARYRQARAAVASARAGLFPRLSGSATASRARGTGNRYSVALDAGWEIDLWGRIRRLVEAARAGEEASAADLEGARLSLQAELATNYFQLRVTDAQRDLLDDTVKAFESSYFPALSLNGAAGFASDSLKTLFSAPSRFWSIGAGLADTLLDFGARGAAVDTSRAAYEETVANYRQIVLQSFQEVEDNLAAVHWLTEGSKVQEEAARAARESVVLTVNQYKAGTVSYLNVVQVQATQLNEERNTVNLLGRRLAATVALIRAMGGTW